MTKEKTLLQQKRERVAELENEVRQALTKKQGLEHQAKAEREQIEWDRGHLAIPARVPLRQRVAQVFQAQVRQIENLEPEMSADVRAWLRQHAPEKLPVEAVPEYTLSQQAKVAHNDYCDLSYRLQRARFELAQLEKKVADLAALMACVA